MAILAIENGESGASVRAKLNQLIAGEGVAGADKGIQFNDEGVQGADVNFTYNKSTSTLSVPNLTVSGTTTTINSTVTTIEDPVLTLGGDTAPIVDDNLDRGIEFRYHTGAAAKLGFFGFDDSTGRFTFIPDAVNTSEVFSGAVGDLQVGGIFVDSSVTNNALVDEGSTAGIFFSKFITGDISVSSDDANFGGTSGGELYMSKGTFDEISLYLNGGAAIQAFSFDGSTKGIRLDASVTGITAPIRTSIGHTLVSMGDNTDSSTNSGEIVLGVAGAVDVVSDATARQAIIIGSKSSTFKTGVTESVILGGTSITALNSDTVYTTNLVIQETKKLSVDLIGESAVGVGVNVDGLLLKDNVLHGGVASGADLTLSSTSNATKGKILFGTSVYDEVNNSLGIGTSVFGTNAVGVLAISNATSPTAALANGIQIGAKDTAGESTSTLELFLEQAVEAIGTFTPSHKIKIVLNGVEYWIQLDAV